MLKIETFSKGLSYLCANEHSAELSDKKNNLTFFLGFSKYLFVYNFGQLLNNLSLINLFFNKSFENKAPVVFISTELAFDSLVEALALQNAQLYINSTNYTPGMFSNAKQVHDKLVNFYLNKTQVKPAVAFLVCFNPKKRKTFLLKELQALNIPVFGLGFSKTRATFLLARLQCNSFILLRFFTYFLSKRFVSSSKKNFTTQANLKSNASF